MYNQAFGDCVMMLQDAKEANFKTNEMMSLTSSLTDGLIIIYV